MANDKKQSFWGGAAVLAAGIAIVKVIGALFKIPLSNILGEAGAADFNNAYNIYAAFLNISTAGLPVALSKMVSEANTLGRVRQSRRIFRVSLSAFLFLGAISFALMWFGNDFFAGLLNNERAAHGIRALAPAVVCVGCLSAFRGYAQGNFRMTPTAVSQVLEALCKLFVGLGLAAYVLHLGYPDYIAAAGAIWGVTIGTILALIYMLVNFLRTRAAERVTADDTPDADSAILRRLLSIAVPITLSSCMVSIITIIDTSLVQGQLQNALGYSLDKTRVLYGTYASGMNLYNLPASFMVALTASIIPAVSAALARRDSRGAASIVASSFRITGLLAFPMAVGLAVMAQPIMALLYPRYDSVLGGSLLSVLGVASAFVSIMLISNSVLQAHGRPNLPVITMLIGGVAKIIVNYNLVAIPAVNIHGAPVGTLLCFAIAAFANLFLVRRIMPDAPRYLPLFAKPLAASLAMGICARGAYVLLCGVLSLPNAIGTIGAIGVAVAVYLVLVIILRIITAEDLALLPKGAKIGRILRIK